MVGSLATHVRGVRLDKPGIREILKGEL